MVGNRCSLIATIPLTKHIKDEFDAARDSQLLENPVDVIPDRMFLHPEPSSDFIVLHAVGDRAVPHRRLEPSRKLEAAREQRKNRRQWAAKRMKRITSGLPTIYSPSLIQPSIKRVNKRQSLRILELTRYVNVV
jgi:hypothetical protein